MNIAVENTGVDMLGARLVLSFHPGPLPLLRGAAGVPIPELGLLSNKVIPICLLSQTPRYLPKCCNLEQTRNDCGLENRKPGIP